MALFLPKTPQGSRRRPEVLDLNVDIRKKLLDRAFAEIDRRKIPLKRQYDWIAKNCPAAIQSYHGSSEKQYIVYNGAVPTTAAQVKMAVTTSINTLVQVLTPATTGICIIEWGISFDGAPGTAVPVNVEFFANDVAITGATSLTPTIWGVDTTASLCVGGTAATCFNDGSVTEGTVANARMFDCQLVAPTGQYVKQWPLGREPYMPASKALRIRTTAPAAVNAICYIVWVE